MQHIENSQLDKHGPSATMTDGSGTLLKMQLFHFRNLRKIFSNRFSLIKGNVGKYHLILSADGRHRPLIKSTNCEKPLDIKVYSKFKFDDHIETVCKTASNKIRILAIVIPHMIIENKKKFK